MILGADNGVSEELPALSPPPFHTADRGRRTENFRKWILTIKGRIHLLADETSHILAPISTVDLDEFPKSPCQYKGTPMVFEVEEIATALAGVGSPKPPPLIPATTGHSARARTSLAKKDKSATIRQHENFKQDLQVSLTCLRSSKVVFATTAWLLSTSISESSSSSTIALDFLFPFLNGIEEALPG